MVVISVSCVPLSCLISLGLSPPYRYMHAYMVWQTTSTSEFIPLDYWCGGSNSLRHRQLADLKTWEKFLKARKKKKFHRAREIWTHDHWFTSPSPSPLSHPAWLCCLPFFANFIQYCTAYAPLYVFYNICIHRAVHMGDISAPPKPACKLMDIMYFIYFMFRQWCFCTPVHPF